MFFHHELRDAKIQHLYYCRHIRPLLDEDVCRFQIAMNQPAIVGSAHSRGGLQYDRNSARRIEGPFPRQQLAQRLAFEQLHYDVKIAVASRTEVSYRNRIRMLHVAGGAGLAAKSLLRRFIAHEPLAKNLDGNRTIN